MKPTTDIVEELRLYNRWRRGDEAITAPDPTTLGKLLDDAADRIEHLFASGIHTCHADCQRPMCVLRRERDKAQALRARVAELEQELTVAVKVIRSNSDRAEQAEQRVSELETAIDRCLRENAHLADGDDCTLITIKQALARAESATPAKQEAAR